MLVLRRSSEEYSSKSYKPEIVMTELYIRCSGNQIKEQLILLRISIVAFQVRSLSWSLLGEQCGRGQAEESQLWR